MKINSNSSPSYYVNDRQVLFDMDLGSSNKSKFLPLKSVQNGKIVPKVKTRLAPLTSLQENILIQISSFQNDDVLQFDLEEKKKQNAHQLPPINSSKGPDISSNIKYRRRRRAKPELVADLSKAITNTE
jgi:hypothetical protein